MRVVMFLVAVLFLVNTSAVGLVTAQTKKGADATGTIEIKEGKNGKFYFSIRDEDGKFLGQGGPQGYESVKDAEIAIAKLKGVVAKAKVVVIKDEAPKDTPTKDKAAPKDKAK